MLNLDETMAITQNFMHPHLFEDVWKDFRANRKKLSHFFLRMLRKKQPALHQQALALNQRDKFVMFPDRPKPPVLAPFRADDTTTSIDYSSTDSDKSSSTSYDSRDAELRSSDSEVSQRHKKKKRVGSPGGSSSKASPKSSRSSRSSSNFRSRSRSQERKSEQTNKHTSTS